MKRTSNVLLVLTVVFCLVSLLWSAAVYVTFGLALALAVTSIATPNDKEIGHKAIDNADLFEERLGLAATPFDAKKASGLRFYKDGCKIKNNEAAWPRFISEQLKWAIVMKQVIGELEL